jgi:hypothetical protein
MLLACQLIDYTECYLGTTTYEVLGCLSLEEFDFCGGEYWHYALLGSDTMHSNFTLLSWSVLHQQE